MANTDAVAMNAELLPCPLLRAMIDDGIIDETPPAGTHARSRPMNEMGRDEMLATLERLHAALPDIGVNGWHHGQKAVRAAIAALTAQEPVAWQMRSTDPADCPQSREWRLTTDIGERNRASLRSYLYEFRALYAAPPSQADTVTGEVMTASEQRLTQAGYTVDVDDYSSAQDKQADILSEYELWSGRMIVSETDEQHDAAVDILDSLWRKMTPEQRDQANATAALYSAKLQQADTGKQAEPVSPWLAIESAPRDGTPVLGHDGTHAATVEWYESKYSQYWSLCVTGEHAEDSEWGPTHWQPLPAPPKGSP